VCPSSSPTTTEGRGESRCRSQAKMRATAG
jgi:hypothetical protein